MPETNAFKTTTGARISDYAGNYNECCRIRANDDIRYARAERSYTQHIDIVSQKIEKNGMGKYVSYDEIRKQGWNLTLAVYLRSWGKTKNDML